VSPSGSGFSNVPATGGESADLLPYGDAIARLGDLQPQGQEVHINDIAVSDGTAWLATFRSLYALDVTDRTAPEVVSEYGSQLYRVDLRDGVAAVSGRGQGVTSAQLVEGAIAPLAFYDSPGFTPGGVALLDEHLLVGTTGAGLEVRRRSDFELVTSLPDLPNVVDVAAEGTIAVAIDRELGLVVIDISDIRPPRCWGPPSRCPAHPRGSRSNTTGPMSQPAMPSSSRTCQTRTLPAPSARS